MLSPMETFQYKKIWIYHSSDTLKDFLHSKLYISAVQLLLLFLIPVQERTQHVSFEMFVVMS